MRSGRPRSTVLAYHAVGYCDPRHDVHNLFVSPDAFAEQMDLLARSRRVVGLDEALFGEGPRGKPVVAITFDDGYRSILDHALPVLERHGFPATVFVPTAYVGEANRWDEPGQCALDIMDADELLVAESRGRSIESHGHAHLDLTAADEATAASDIATSLASLRALLGRDAQFLAFPFSHGSPGAQQAATSLGLRAAFSIDRPGTGPFDRPRVQITRNDGLRGFAFKTGGRYVALRHSAASRAVIALTRPIRSARRG